MGMLSLSRLMSKRRRRRPHQIQIMRRRRRPHRIQTRSNRRIGALAKRKGSTSQQDENSLGNEIKRYSGPNLPEDIWCYIHSLMPMRDAAQVACTSRAFVHSWRCHPNLHFSKETLGLYQNTCQNVKEADFNSRVDHILKKHSGIGVKAFTLEIPFIFTEDRFRLDCLDNWLQVAVKPGIEELKLTLPCDAMYNLPCSLLSGGTGGLLRCLSLTSCQFHPTASLCLRSLTRLQLFSVGISAHKLERLLSRSLSLERLELCHCVVIVHLKIPCLQRLDYLLVANCPNLRSIESKAPNVSSVFFVCDLKVQISLENTWRIKTLRRQCNYAVFYACNDLTSIMQNLEALTLVSHNEWVDKPMVHGKFLHLKFLSISVWGRTFDYFSLVSFLDASPALETFILAVVWLWKREEVTSVLEDPLDLRVITGHHHSKLKHVNIIGFCDIKSVVELTCQILESATSLERLALDTTRGLIMRCSVSKTGKCSPIYKDELVEVHKGIMVAQTCIRPKVPSRVEFDVLGPCSRCHAVGL